MRRREFVGALAGSAIGAAVPSCAAEPLPGARLSADSRAPFPLSVMLWTVEPHLPFERRLEMVAQAGYGAAELVHEFDGWEKQDYAAARKKKEELKITFDATAGVWKSLCDPAQRDAFLGGIRAMLPKMEELECTRLIVLSGDRAPGLTPGQMRASCVEGLKRAADIAAASNIELLLENIDPEENPNYFLSSVAEGLAIIREVNSPRVKFLYDFFHEQIAEGNLISKLEKQIGDVGLVHVADVPGRHEPGSGEINYPNIYRKLAELKYQGYVAMEFEPRGDTVTALRAAREMLVRSTREPEKS
jgi:hydroxypyruvate isomerase